MRILRVIAFRLRQELVNLVLTAKPPAIAAGADFAPRLNLPDGAECARALKGSRFAQEVTDLAEEIRGHRFPIFGLTIDTGPEIQWRRDYIRGIETDLLYFRRIPFLDTPRTGDHKIVWELNRHQHLVVLAQAFLLTGDSRNLDEICAQLDSWMDCQSVSSRNQLGEFVGSSISGAFVDLDRSSGGAKHAGRVFVRDGAICFTFMVAIWRTISRSITRRTTI